MGNKPIVHAPIATGSTEPRDIRDRFADFVNLKDFGAVGDGITDDSSAWAAWRTALQNGGMPYIPKGDYLLGEEVIHAPKGHWGRSVSSVSFDDGGPVLDAFSSPVYISPAGNDSSDGMSAATAVQTFARAKEIAESIPQSRSKFFVAAGTYNGNIVISEENFYIQLLGNVTVNGYINVLNNATLLVNGDYDFNLVANNADDAILVQSGSSFVCESKLNITTNANYTGIRVIAGSSIWATKAVSITMNSATGYAIYFSSSFGDFSGKVSIGSPSGTTVAAGIYVLNCSYTNFRGGITQDTTIAGTSLFLHKCSACTITNDLGVSSYLRGGASTYAAVMVYGCSTLEFTGAGSCEISHRGSAWGGCIVAEQGFVASNSNLTLSLWINATSGGAFVLSGNCSVVRFEAGSVAFSGTATQTVYSAASSCIAIMYNVSLSGSPTGKRFAVDRCSIIEVQDQGVNRIPGSSPGSIDSSSFGFYR